MVAVALWQEGRGRTEEAVRSMAEASKRGRARTRGSKSKKTKSSGSPRSEGRKLLGPSQVHTEAMAVLLGCCGLLTLLSLMSYHPADVSLNASGSSEVHNWIGTAGGYWADFLLQVLGVGAFPFGAGLLMAGWRALLGKRIMPGFREVFGILCLIGSLGTFAHLMAAGEAHSFPPGVSSGQSLVVHC